MRCIYIYIYMCVCVCVCVRAGKIYFVIYWPIRCILTEKVLKLKPSIEGDTMTNDRLSF